MGEFLFEHNYREYADILHVDDKKFRVQRLTYALVFAVLSIAVILTVRYTTKTNTILWMSPVIIAAAAFMGWKWMYLSLKNAYDEHLINLGLLFPEFLTTFISLVSAQSGANIIDAIRNSIPYIKEPLRGQVIRLVLKIDADSSVDNVWVAFTEFTDYVKDKDASQVMMLIYDMLANGTNQQALHDLEEKIMRMNENKVKEFSKKKHLRIKESGSLPAVIISVFYILAWAGVVAAVYLSSGMSAL